MTSSRTTFRPLLLLAASSGTLAAQSPASVWKTMNNGLAWKGVFTHQASFAVGDATVAPSDENVVWVDTGEAQSRHSGDAYPGTGVFKSVDAGARLRGARASARATFAILPRQRSSSARWRDPHHHRRALPQERLLTMSPDKVSPISPAAHSHRCQFRPTLGLLLEVSGGGGLNAGAATHQLHVVAYRNLARLDHEAIERQLAFKAAIDVTKDLLVLKQRVGVV